MEALTENPLLSFHPDTLDVVRKTYNLDKPGEMDKAIDILESWVQQQEHFVKKDFNRSYLEIVIIRSKGSIELAKKRLDKTCTARALLPDFFGVFSIADLDTEDLRDVALPRLTKNHERVYLVEISPKEIDPEYINKYIKRIIYMMEYVSKYDYNNGIIFISDYRNANILEIIKAVNISLLAQVYKVIINGYGFRLKSAHIIASSKLVNLLVTLVFQVLGEKIAKRIQLHNTLETIYDHVDKDVLTTELGGTEKSLKELHEDWLKVLTSKDFTDYIKEMNEFKTNEDLRISDNKNNEEILGIPGTFRTLSVD